MKNSLSRRQFGTSILSGGALLSATQTTQAKGNRWTATGLKLGVGGQRPEMLTNDHLNYLKQMGVEYLEVWIPAAQSGYDNLVAIKRKVEGAGLKLNNIIVDTYNSREFTLGLPGRDKEIAFFQNFLKDLGKAGVDTTTYAWNTLGPGGSTGRATTRGCSARLFELSKAGQKPPEGERGHSEEEMWANYEYFIKRVLPVAEDAGVRLQLHPNDPPTDYMGAARIFKSRQAFRRALEISGYSPYSGFLFCVGCWGESAGPDGKGEDIPGAIREFGSRGHIFTVHYRNVSSPVPSFYETFPDNGYLNMYNIMRALGEVNFNGMLVPDHVPRCGDDAVANRVGEAYIFGYIRAMIQAVETELGSRLPT